jgi:hypothetical protein
MKTVIIQLALASLPSPHPNMPLDTNVYVLGQCETPSFTDRQNCNTLYSLTFWCVGLVHSEYTEATSCLAGQEIPHLRVHIGPALVLYCAR